MSVQQKKTDCQSYKIHELCHNTWNLKTCNINQKNISVPVCERPTNIRELLPNLKRIFYATILRCNFKGIDWIAEISERKNKAGKQKSISQRWMTILINKKLWWNSEELNSMRLSLWYVMILLTKMIGL